MGIKLSREENKEQITLYAPITLVDGAKYLYKSICLNVVVWDIGWYDARNETFNYDDYQRPESCAVEIYEMPE